MGNRTALVNQARGILLEYGVAIPKEVASVRNRLGLLLAEARWSALVRQFLTDQQAELRYWEEKIEAVTAQITRGNAQQPICQLLIHGALAVVSQVGKKPDRLSCWIRWLVARRGMNKAVVPRANKNARMAFALIHKDEPYDVTKMCGRCQ